MNGNAPPGSPLTDLTSHAVARVSPPPVSFETGAPARRAPRTVARVLHVINGEHYSGAERVQDLLAGGLHDQGFEAGLICLKPGQFPSKAKTKTAPLLYAPMRSRFDLTVVWPVLQAVRHGHYDLLHAHTPRTLLIARLVGALAHIPVVYHVHSPAAHDSTSSWNNWLNGHMETACLRGVAKIITVSQSLAQSLRDSGMSEDRITVVPNGVPAVPLDPRPQPTGSWTLGTIALFRPRKGTEILLEALALLRDRNVPVKLRAVGPFESDRYREKLLDLVAKHRLERLVTWTGFTDNVTEELQRMDLMVLPSLFGEGMPMVVLEAMAAGVPVVASRVEGVPEVIRDQQEGLLVPPGDAPALADAVASLVQGQHDWTQMRQRAQQRHAERFSAQAMAAGVSEVYRRVLA